jgi:hypothetical protein
MFYCISCGCEYDLPLKPGSEVECLGCMIERDPSLAPLKPIVEAAFAKIDKMYLLTDDGWQRRH